MKKNYFLTIIIIWSTVSEYLLINLGIIAVPLALTFEKRMRFYKKLPAVLISMVMVGFLFVTWDIYATVNSHWMFNPEYISGVKIFKLPFEELLFFITVPYAMLFLYETFIFYLKERADFNIEVKKISLIISLIFLIAAILLYTKPYTFLAFISVALYFFISYRFYNHGINSGLFWIFILFSYLPFFIVNYLLTSLPVVIYNPGAIIGTRITTIPVEDFFYSFALIAFYSMVYTIAVNKWKLRA
jgi:lycopene cyclase domain-containing protein